MSTDTSTGSRLFDELVAKCRAAERERDAARREAALTKIVLRRAGLRPEYVATLRDQVERELAAKNVKQRVASR